MQLQHVRFPNFVAKVSTSVNETSSLRPHHSYGLDKNMWLHIHVFLIFFKFEIDTDIVPHDLRTQNSHLL